MTDQNMTDFVRAQIAQRTNLPLEDVQENSVLVDIGLESIDAVLLCGDVEDTFGVEIDPSMIFEHDTLGEFVNAISALKSST
jgi:acyl carrier protein